MALTGITAHLGLFQQRPARRRARRSTSPAAAAGSARWSSRWPRPPARRVATSAGSPEKVELCKALGADLALNYKTDDIPARLREFAPDGIDVWYETQREPNLEVAVPLLRKRGRMILMAGRTAKPVLPLGSFYPRDCSLHGFAMFNATPDEQELRRRGHPPLGRRRPAQAPRRPRLPPGRGRRGRAVPRREHRPRRGHALGQGRDRDRRLMPDDRISHQPPSHDAFARAQPACRSAGLRGVGAVAEDLVAAVGLGLVEGWSAFESSSAGDEAGDLGDRRDADADRDAEGSCRSRARRGGGERPRNGRRSSRRRRGRSGGRSPRTPRRRTGRQVGRPDRRPEHGRRPPQGLVARGVAVGVVDPLEVVEVGDPDRQRDPRGAGAGPIRWPAALPAPGGWPARSGRRRARAVPEAPGAAWSAGRPGSAPAAR